MVVEGDVSRFVVEVDGGEDDVRDAGEFGEEWEDRDVLSGGKVVRLVVAYYAGNWRQGLCKRRHDEGCVQRGCRVEEMGWMARLRARVRRSTE